MGAAPSLEGGADGLEEPRGGASIMQHEFRGGAPTAQLKARAPTAQHKARAPARPRGLFGGATIIDLK